MNANPIDSVSKYFAERKISRRQAMIQGGAGLAVAGIATTGLTKMTVAQDATPEVGATGPKMLFVQTYQSGTISPKEGDDGRYILSLEAGNGQTVYFSDRPDRIVGTNPTPQFLEGLGFPDDNPPNAALVVETSPTDSDIAVVELFAPKYDPESQSVSFEIEVLANWQKSLEMEFSEAPTDLATFVPSFGAAQLFIDDCPDMTMTCYTMDGQTPVRQGTIDNGEHDGFCYSWGRAGCYPCQPWDPNNAYAYWAAQCNQRFDGCAGECGVSKVCSAGLQGECDRLL
jgi:hypothetical protein